MEKGFYDTSKNRDYANPYMAEKIMKILDIDEYWTNFTPATFNPIAFLELKEE